MSTGQPPSGDTSGKEKSSADAADKPELKHPQTLGVDEGWDLRDVVPLAGHGVTDGQAPARPGSATGSSTRPTVPPTSTRGKFTVGNLLSATQGTSSALQKRGETAGVHRQQIGALPQRTAALGAVSPKPMEPRKTTPAQPFAAQSVPEASTPRRSTPPQFAAVLPQPVPERSTPSQPFAAVPSPAPPRRITSLASPMVSVGEEMPRVAQAGVPRHDAAAQSADVDAEVHARALLEPELHEKTPRGIGAVTISSPPATSERASLDQPGPNSLTMARIIPIVTVSIERGAAAFAPDPGAVAVGPVPSAPERPALAVTTATPLPVPVAVQSRPPPPAAVLDDPDGWDLAASSVNRSVPAELPPPAVSKERPAETSAGSVAQVAISTPDEAANGKSAAKVALDKARASKGKLKAAAIESSRPAAKKTPSSHSKLLRAGSAEGDLSGEFFAVSLSEESAADSARYHQTEELLDERHQRSLSPEVVARRARYRRIVVFVVVSFVLLLGAAIALKLLHRR